MSKIDLRTTGDLLLAAQDLVLCCHVTPMEIPWALL